tara:strand:- start:3960 stop:4259 length:300 start_codon:yes stop_codon:yes gene_type:complete
MKNFTKKDIINKIYQEVGFSKNMSSIIIDDFFDVISTELIKNGKIKISNFGTFVVLEKKERLGRNPKTKEQAKISARKIVKFIPSDKIKNKINKVDEPT